MHRMLVVVGLAALGLLTLASPAAAQDEAASQLSLNTTFFLLVMVLVFLMHPGFAMLEAGMTSSRNAANIMMKNMLVVTIGFVVYYLVGWGLHYGTSIGGLVGSDQLFLVPGTWSATIAGSEFVASELMFDAVFAATAATIISGAVAGRMNLWGFFVIAVAMTAVIYPVVGHWAWTDSGWLASMGFTDFAGSTVVHLTGGTAGLVAAAILGPRVGKYAADGTPRPIFPHSAPLAVLGVFMLFFGWFGFNGGSVLNAELSVGPVLLMTALAASTGGLTAAILSALRSGGKTDISMTGNGILAGLVGITAGADAVEPWAAMLVGIVAGIVVSLAVPAIERLRIDDPVGAVSVHGVCGVLGTWWVGLFAVEGGLFYGGGAQLLVANVVGTVAVIAWVAATVGAICLVLRRIGLLRLDDAAQEEGVDVHEHGVAGYPEPVGALGGSAASAET